MILRSKVHNIEPLFIDMQETVEVIERKRVTGPDSERAIALVTKNLVDQGYAVAKIIVDKGKFFIEAEREKRDKSFTLRVV